MKYAVYDRGSIAFGNPQNWRAVELFNDVKDAEARCVKLNKRRGQEHFTVAKYDGREVTP